MISLVALLHFKSDAILRQVTNSVQNQLQDSIVYSNANLNWYRHFPSTSIHFDDLQIGHPDLPLLKGESLDLIIPLFSILQGKVKVQSLQISNAEIHIEPHLGKWTYEIFKIKDGNEKASVKSDTTGVTDINEVLLFETKVIFKDKDGNVVTTSLEEAILSGKISNDKYQVDWKAKGIMNKVKLPFADLPHAIPLDHEGEYVFEKNQHSLTNLKLESDGFIISGDVNISEESKGTFIDLKSTIGKSALDSIAVLLPDDLRKLIKSYGVSGRAEGEFTLKGISGEKTQPLMNAHIEIDPMTLHHPSMKEKLGGIEAIIDYERKDPNPVKPDQLSIALKKSGMEVDLSIINTSNPVIGIKAKGDIPAPLLNLADVSNLIITDGEFHVEDFTIENLSSSSTSNFVQWLSQTEGDLTVEDFECTYAGKKIACSKGRIINRSTKAFTLHMDAFEWDKAVVEDMDVELSPISGGYDFKIDGKSCEGEIDGKGQITGIPSQPVMHSKWTARDVEIQKIMSSLNDFGQTFITQKNISGKAKVYVQATIPFNSKWQINSKGITALTALEIHDGRLESLSTLEDFGKYIHIEDLRDIKFQQLRNYLEIKNGSINIPVMFIQSSAVNLSISGEHTFDQRIHYDIKVNAGQTLANKVKKRDILQSFKASRKSGWINMYYILNGTTSNVDYKQDRKMVIASFESSSAQKEVLRKKLVDLFGYDVYWLEPNEWEEIPEYR